jgi:hypothetical protein
VEGAGILGEIARGCGHGRVTFRLRAPNAKEAAVSMSGKQLPMQKDEQGLSFTAIR